jgi:hypothetical protein
MQPRKQRDSHREHADGNPELDVSKNRFQHWINLKAVFLRCQKNKLSKFVESLPALKNLAKFT